MWLAIDTSGDRATVAVGDAAGPRAERALAGARQHAGALLPMIDVVLGESGVTLDALDGVLLADGPGSFTGLRVGASVVKGLLATRQLEFRTAPALLIAATGALPPHAGPILSVRDALRGELYAAVYDRGDGRVGVLRPPTVVAAADAPGLAPRGAALVGIAAEPVLAALAHALGGPRLVAPASPAAVLLELLDVDGALTSVTDAERWEPVYGRPAEAQRKWEETHGRSLPDPPGHLS
jgi:tRNA threonylcarbamoyladenosine biosynthesis protein TsaB